MKSNAVESLPPPSPHTPGPWTLTVGQTEPTSKGGNVFVRQGPGVYGSFICHVHPRNGESNETEVVYDAEAMANARLIASAPQLAEDLARVTAERDRLHEAVIALYDATTANDRDQIMAARTVARKALKPTT